MKKLLALLAVLLGISLVPHKEAHALVISDFSKSYQEMKTMYQYLPDALQVTSDKVTMQEFALPDDRVFAGHLGGFHALPYYSAVRDFNYELGMEQYADGFNVGLGFSNEQYRVWESPSSLEEGTWYPHKLVVTKDYLGGGGGHRITGTKFGLPNSRSLALKLNINYHHSAGVAAPNDDMGLLFWINIPRIGKLGGLEGTWFNNGCEDHNRCSDRGKAYRNESRHDEFYYYGRLNGGATVCMPFKVVTSKEAETYTFTSHIEDHTTEDIITDDDILIKSGHRKIFEDFEEEQSPELNGANGDTGGIDGSTIGIHFQPDIELANSSYDIALIVAIGGAANREACRQKVGKWLGGFSIDSIEENADKTANDELSALYQNFPKFDAPKQSALKQMYENSFFNLPFNTFKKDPSTVGANHNGLEPLNLKDTYVQMIPFFGQCGGMYPWATARFSYAWALADPPGLKEEIIKYLALDWSKERAYDNILGRNRGDDIEYSFNYWSMSKIIYDYVTTTSDFAFLNEVHPTAYGRMSIMNYFVKIVDLPETTNRRWDGQIGPSSQLIDFGDDTHMWEFQIHCDHGDKLTGFIASPNAERYAQNKMLAALYRARGEGAQVTARESKANQIRGEIFSKLWNPSSGMFNTISIYKTPGDIMYYAGEERPAYTSSSCNRNLDSLDTSGQSTCGLDTNIRDGGLLSDTNLPVPMQMHTLDYAGFWDGHEAEKAQLIHTSLDNPSTSFSGPYGLTSLPYAWRENPPFDYRARPLTRRDNEEHWCAREDWHGPGLYSGEVTHILKGLFKEDFEEKAMGILNTYSYLQNAPFWAEALPYKEPAFPVGGYAALSYMDGSFGFSEVIVQGLFGITTTTRVTEIKPRIPSSFGAASLTDLNVQTHKFDIRTNAADTHHQIEMCITCKRDGSGPIQNHTGIRYGPDGRKRVSFSFRNLLPGNYDITIYDSPDDTVPYRETPIIAHTIAATGGDGVLRYENDSWHGTHIIEVVYHEGDLSQNGEIDSQDATILLGDWGTDTVPEADFNTDGDVNGLDFGRLRYIIGHED